MRGLDQVKFGLRVMYAREERNMTRDELSGMIDVSYQQLAMIENGQRKPGLELLYSICNALRVSPAYLMQDGLEQDLMDHFEKLYQILKPLPPRQLAIMVDILEVISRHIEDDKIK